jgi:hypothetical protein
MIKFSFLYQNKNTLYHFAKKKRTYSEGLHVEGVKMCLV